MGKIKTLLTITFLLFVLSNQAQEKYEYMIIEFNSRAKEPLKISIDGKEYMQEKSDYVSKSDSDNTPLLKKISEYQDKGWECMNITPIGFAPVLQFAYLKKKKK